MTHPALFHMRRQALNFVSDCEGRRRRVGVANSMGEVKRLTDIHLRSELRPFAECRQARSHLQQTAEQRLYALLDEQLVALTQSPNTTRLNAERDRLISTEWTFLRGDFADVYRKAERDSRRLLYRLQQQEAASPAPPDSAEGAPTI
jgi:hypothetical protein